MLQNDAKVFAVHQSVYADTHSSKFYVNRAGRRTPHCLIFHRMIFTQRFVRDPYRQ